MFIERTRFCMGSCHTQGSAPNLGFLAPPPVLLGNTHNMVTRSKVGIFTPKALKIEAIDYEPRTVEEAFVDLEWKLAIQVEFDTSMAKSIWELVSLPHGRKVIGCKWLFKIKKNADGTVTRQKPRLVSKGCLEVPRCDFKETFSPVVKPVTIRTIFMVVVSCGWQLHRVDVNNAFLNGDLIDEVFMQQPPGYVQTGPTRCNWCVNWQRHCTGCVKHHMYGLTN
ncbi:uncharacterized mitochondrial protein AtMg00820 isoform X1 [Gossypium hirsutum]|uniref:Uncharacterized mitochondrial protein AtMg00820 isoform X1 n=1 Tax=Gossypium hirsutum TaxID=3635 RepID=A0ABM3C3G1_GOSHI|nr:uncharacterized mitochondrial protein AtMg00820-like isoform X1 [Gossypium hirsutum]XP_040973838.1 uncharacterized mitochondrial protein AtMg00820-like isoform X1 [Gossypium hirsutum]